MKLLLTSLVTMICITVIAQPKEGWVKKNIENQETDWNKNDMKAYSMAFTKEGTLINFLGMYWSGRENIEMEFSHINDCCIKTTSLKLELVDVNLIGDDCAVAHVKETLTAKVDYPVPGAVIKKGTISYKYITEVFEKKGGQWLISTMQVTEIRPMDHK